MNESINQIGSYVERDQTIRNRRSVSLDDIFAMDEVFISPAGVIGRALCSYLEKNSSVGIRGFVDQQGSGTILGKPVYPVSDISETNSLVIVAYSDPLVSDEIVKNLLTANVDNIAALDNESLSTISELQDLEDLAQWKKKNGFLARLKEFLSIIDMEKVPIVYVDYRFFPYDFTVWILLQNINFELDRLNCKKFDLVIVDDRSKARRKGQEYFDDPHKTMLMQNMLFDGITMIKRMRNFIYFRNRWSATLYYTFNFFRKKIPSNYNVLYSTVDNNFPAYKHVTGLLHYFSVTQQEVINNKATLTNKLTAIDFTTQQVDKWLKIHNIDSSKLVTVSIRNTSVDKNRNSNIDEWMKASRQLSIDYDLQIVLLPDYYDLYNSENYNGFSDFSVFCNEALLSIRFRMALYSTALLNIGVECGTSVFLWCTDNPFMLYKNTNVGFNLKANKLSVGEDLAHFNQFQKYLWGDETAKNIYDNASAMLEKIGASKRS